MDLKESMDWYDLQKSGLGLVFFEFVQIKLDQIKENPTHYGLRFKNVRVALVDKFPFKIFYEIFPEKIVVYTFYHTSRNPKRVIKRLK